MLSYVLLSMQSADYSFNIPTLGELGNPTGNLLICEESSNDLFQAHSSALMVRALMQTLKQKKSSVIKEHPKIKTDHFKKVKTSCAD